MIQRPKGTQDVLPGVVDKWQYVEDVAIGKAKMKIMDSGKEADVELNSGSITEVIFYQVDEGGIM